MEDWQIDFINKNLNILVAFTSCNVQFLSYFVQFGILSDEEIEKLKLPILTDMEKAYALYSILKTKTTAYDVLKIALIRTSQTGAANILQDAENQCISYYQYEMLTLNEKHPEHQDQNTISFHKGTFAKRPALVKVITNTESFKEATKELDMLAELDWHENVLRCFVGKFLAREKPLICVKPFAIAMEDATQMNKIINEDTCQQTKIRVCCDMINGVKYLHQNKILHLNLKPETMFIINSRIRIGDFRFARKINNEHEHITIRLQDVRDLGAGFTAEVCKHLTGVQNPNEKNDEPVTLNLSADVFCLALVIHHFLSTPKPEHPFGGYYVQRQNIGEGKPALIKESVLDVMTQPGKDQFCNALLHNVEERPDIFSFNLFS